MIDPDDAASPEALSARLRSLEDRVANFERQQTLSEQHTARAEAIRRRRREIEGQIDAAIARGDHWTLVRDEFRRDFAGVSDELDAFIASVDTEG